LIFWFSPARKACWKATRIQLASIWRRYDLALSTQASDRSRIFALAAAPITLGFVTQESGAAFKQRLLDHSIVFDDRNTHTVSLNLLLARALGLEPVTQVVNPTTASHNCAAPIEQRVANPQACVVLHPSPKFRYKMWRDDAWSQLGIWLQSLGFRVLLTASPDPEEKAYVDQIAQAIGEGCQSLAGSLSLAQTADLIKQARLYVGPDTAVTHMAAASGTPTIALFGPSNPVKWGPWPYGRKSTESPWTSVGSGRQGNVWLIQGEGTCVPCTLEGCDRNEASESRCLQDLPLDRVKQAAKQALGLDNTPVAIHRTGVAR
jgi:heptosyltransferase III